MITIEKIEIFCKKYNEMETSYGIGQCYYESIWEENGDLQGKLSTAGSKGAPYYVFGTKTREDIKKDLMRVFLK